VGKKCPHQSTYRGERMDQQLKMGLAEELVRIMGLPCDEKNVELYNLRRQILSLPVEGGNIKPTQTEPEAKPEETEEE